MKTFRYLYNFLFFLVIVALPGCYESEKNVVSNQMAWFSYEPLSIPYKFREKEYQAGNLVLNASFEEGKSYLDSALSTYNLKA